MNIKTQIFSIAAQQFQPECIGTKVLIDQEQFTTNVLVPSIEKLERTKPVVVVGVEDAVAREIFSCGVGAHTHNPEDYVVRKWRDEVLLCLRREHAARTVSANLIVHTRDAFLSDPQLTGHQRAWLEDDTTHVLVACLASGGPEESLPSPHRWVRNLAGDSSAPSSMLLTARILEKSGYDPKVAKAMDPETLYGAGIDTAVQHFVSEAVAIASYDALWCVVAD